MFINTIDSIMTIQDGFCELSNALISLKTRPRLHFVF